MKTKNIIVLLISSMLLYSCFKDESTLDTMEIEGVVIDTTGMSELSVFQFDNLIVEPDLQFSENSDLSYEWRINLAPNDTTYQVIGEERNLNYQINNSPTASGRLYQIFYKVTNNDTGVEYIMTWPLTIRNSIGEGLVVAVTADGVSTDFSHIMSPEVTPDFNETDIKYHIYSARNGETLPGIVKDMRFYQIYAVDALIALTDDTIYRINTLDYTLEGSNEDLFFVAPEVFKPQALSAATQADLLVNNGDLTSTYLGISKKFGSAFSSEFEVPSIIGVNAKSNVPVVLSFYDEENDSFIYQSSFQSFGDTNMYENTNSSDAFDASTVENKTNLAAGVSTDSNFRHLLKDENTGIVELFVFDGGSYPYPDPIVPPTPIAKYSLEDAPEIDDAEFFVLLDNQKVMYYATKTKIYAMIYSSGTPVFEERYEAPAGEEITTLQIYQQADYPFRYEGWDPPYLPTNNKQLVMSTYDGSEGKVYLLPLVNTGVGNIDDANIKVFSGFDRITAITTQL